MTSSHESRPLFLLTLKRLASGLENVISNKNVPRLDIYSTWSTTERRLWLGEKGQDLQGPGSRIWNCSSIFLCQVFVSFPSYRYFSRSEELPFSSHCCRWHKNVKWASVSPDKVFDLDEVCLQILAGVKQQERWQNWRWDPFPLWRSNALHPSRWCVPHAHHQESDLPRDRRGVAEEERASLRRKQ